MALGDAANPGDLGRDLGSRQYAALAGLGALAEFEFEHAHLLDGGDRLELVIRQRAGFVAHAVLGGADLENDVATAFEVPLGQAAFAGVEPVAGHFRAL